MPDSARVGTSGSADERLAEVTASARNLPPVTCGAAGGMAAKAIGVWFATVDWIAGRGTAERHAGGIEFERKLEQFGGELRRRADAGIGDADI